MQWLRSSFASRPLADRAAMLAYATRIERIASFALLDGGRGAALARRVLHETHSEADAIRGLLRLLPATIRTPRAALSSTAEPPADLVLTIAQPWSPRVRAMLGFVLWGDLDRDDLIAATSNTTVTRSVAACVIAIGDALGSIPRTGSLVACEHTEAAIIDVAHFDHDDTVRGHVLGCAACRARLAGFRDTMSFVRSALEAQFPPTLTPLIPDQTEQSRRVSPSAKIAALVAIVALACGVLAMGRAPDRTSAVAATLRADDVLQRAASRFDAPQRGVSHERYSMTGQQTLVIERWSDVAQGRLRVRVADEQANVNLDLVAGGDRLRYTIAIDGKPTPLTFEHPQVRDLLPMLWMLPDGGGLGAFPLIQRGTDASFIRAARLNGARLLGTTRIHGRTAYLLSYRQPADPLWQEPEQDIVLTIDAMTYAVLRASDIGTQARASTRILWQAETVETLTEAPASIFDTGTDSPIHALPDPRLLTFGAFTNIRLDDVPTAYGMMPIPVTLPAATSLAFLREDNTGIIQVYEGKDTTVALITSPPPLPSISMRRLQYHTGDTYWDIVDDQRDITQVELIRNTDPTHRTRLYLWHADADAAERRAMIDSIVASIRWVKQGSDDILGERFEDAAAR